MPVILLFRNIHSYILSWSDNHLVDKFIIQSQEDISPWQMNWTFHWTSSKIKFITPPCSITKHCLVKFWFGSNMLGEQNLFVVCQWKFQFIWPLSTEQRVKCSSKCSVKCLVHLPMALARERYQVVELSSHVMPCFMLSNTFFNLCRLWTPLRVKI